MKVVESLNVTFNESPSPTKLSLLVDYDVDEEEAIKRNVKVVDYNNIEDESIEVDEVVNIKESKNHLLEQVIDGIFFNQSKYIKEMLKKFGLEDSKPTKTPMSKKIKLTKDDKADSVDTKYQAEYVFAGKACQQALWMKQALIDNDEKYKSLALKEKKISSDEEASRSDRGDEEYVMVVTDFKKFFRKRGKFIRQPHDDKKTFRREKEEKKVKEDRRCCKCGDPNHFISDCPKHSYNDQKAFVGGCWSDSDEDDDPKKYKKCLMAHDLNEGRGGVGAGSGVCRSGLQEWGVCRGVGYGSGKKRGERRTMTNIGVRNLAYYRDMLNEIGQVNIEVSEDTCVWSLGSNGTFTIKEARNLIDQKTLPSLSPSTTWDKKIPRKVNIFMWRLLLDRLPYRLNLSLCGMDIPAIFCSSCNGNVESANHIFFECIIASEMWKLVYRWCKIPFVQTLSFEAFKDWFSSWHAPKEMKHRLYVISTLVLWWIWKLHNNVTFNSQPLRKSDIFDYVQSSSFSWLHNRSNLILSWTERLKSPLMTAVENFNLEDHSHPVVTMADQRTMAQLHQAPTEGYEDAIVFQAITADNFELKHGLLTLLDTFYNALNSKDQDSLNSAVGGDFLDKMPRECLSIIESKSKVRYSCDKPVVAKVSTNASTSGVSPDVAELKDMVVENEPEATKDTVNPTNNENTEDVQPQAVQSESQVISEPAIAPVSASKPNPKALIPYPSRRNEERNREKANNQIKKFYQIFKDMSFEISFAYALILMPKFASTLKALNGNKVKLSEMAQTLLNEHCFAVLLKKLPKKLGDPDKFLIPCDFPGMAECLALADLGASI
nr:RNA-directed DNA polymerase, eukaryota [Tanacetum cinerariifolium]